MNTVEVTSDFYSDALLNRAIVTRLFYALCEKEFGEERIDGYKVWEVAESLARAKIGQIDKGEDE